MDWPPLTLDTFRDPEKLTLPRLDVRGGQNYPTPDRSTLARAA